MMMIMVRRRRRLIDEMGSRYNFCGLFYVIVIGNNTKSGWPTSATPGLATTKRLENALQTCNSFASQRIVGRRAQSIS
jgi:hypothetical protein